MSKIPVPNGGFRSWLSANEGKTSKNVLYEQKYQHHHEKIRNKENMSNGEGRSSSSFVSMVNPRPTAEDYENYDADRRLKERARDMRVAQRSASSSARNSFSMTPEPKETSPTNEQYFTPQRRSSSGLEEEFVTPTTSKKERRKERKSPGSSDVTPVSTKPPRDKTSDQQAFYTTCLSRKMEENFSKMQDLVFSGHSLQEAREHTITGATIRDHIGRSPRRSSRRSIDDTVIVNRSSSQPPPFESLNMLSTLSRPESPVPSTSTIKETPILRTSYVDTLVATHQMQIQYSDYVVVGVERQMTKLESMKLLQNLAALSKSPAAEEAKRRRMAAEALRKLVETNEQKAKKIEVIRDLKERIGKVTNVQYAIHQLVSNQPFQGDPYNERILNSLDGWTSLPFKEFDVQTARELQVLNRKMTDTFNQFKNVAAMHRKNRNLNRSLNRTLNGRKSAVKITPSGASCYDSSSDSVHPPQKSKTREASTQVTARLGETTMTQTSPRSVGVEPLDLSSLEKANSSSQTTPTVFESVVKPSPSLPVQTAPVLSMTEPTTTVADIDDMLNNIVLHNKSLDALETSHHFKSDISYPTITTPTSEHSTPRSARVSLDTESARRLSAGVSHFLEQIKKENELYENKEETSHEVSIPVSDTTKRVESPTAEEQAEVSSDNQTPSSQEESELDLNVGEHDATQFEHEMEEEEEQRRLRETAQTPTPPVDREPEIESYRRATTLVDPEDDEDETKKFGNNESFEKSIEEEISGSNGNESADDSGFLLSNKPLPPLKSIFDNVSKAPTSPLGLRADTPRSPQVDDSSFIGIDMEEYCQKDFLNEMGPIMVRKAIELQKELRGLDWISAQSVWKPPSFEEINVDYYDHFDYFDSFAIVIWGAVVDLINQNYLKFVRKLTKEEESSFEKEALEMLQSEYGPDSKKKEWCGEVKISKKLNGMNPYELDYRYDVRRGLPEIEKQKYQWQQVQMVVIADRYPRKYLIGGIAKVYHSEKEKLARVILSNEIEQYAVPNDPNQEENVDKVNEDLAAVSDV